MNDEQAARATIAESFSLAGGNLSYLAILSNPGVLLYSWQATEA